MHWGSHVELPNSQRISCLESPLGRVTACDAGDPGLIPGRGKLNVCLQGALLEDRDDPGKFSLQYCINSFGLKVLSSEMDPARIRFIR